MDEYLGHSHKHLFVDGQWERRNVDIDDQYLPRTRRPNDQFVATNDQLAALLVLVENAVRPEHLFLELAQKYLQTSWRRPGVRNRPLLNIPGTLDYLRANPDIFESLGSELQIAIEQINQRLSGEGADVVYRNISRLRNRLGDGVLLPAQFPSEENRIGYRDLSGVIFASKRLAREMEEGERISEGTHVDHGQARARFHLQAQNYDEVAVFAVLNGYGEYIHQLYPEVTREQVVLSLQETLIHTPNSLLFKVCSDAMLRAEQRDRFTPELIQQVESLVQFEGLGNELGSK